MNSLIENIKKGFYDEKAFRHCYILSLFFSSLCFVEHGFQFITGIMMLWAVFLLKNRFDNFESIRSIRFYGLIFLFLGNLMYTILTYNDNLSTNFITLYHTAICFILLYGIHSNSDKNKIRKEFFSICRIITILTTLFAALGFIVFLIFIKIEAFSYIIGLYGKRFTGLYTHPNIAAFTSVIGIVCSHLVYRQFDYYVKGRKKSYSLLCLLCLVLNILTILLSDSNASLVFLLVYVSVILFFKALDKYTHIKLSVVFSLAIVCIIISTGTFLLRNVSQSAMSVFVNTLHHSKGSDVFSSASYDNQNKNSSDDIQESDIMVEIGRNERKDLSSGRLDSWIKGLKLFSMEPLTGIGKGNILEYGDRYLDEGFKFFDLHNGYLTILVSCGIIGFSIFVIFLLFIARSLFKYVFFNTDKDIQDLKCVPVFSSAICAYCVYSMFERTMLFENTFMVTIFWFMLGYMMSITVSDKVSLEPEHLFANYQKPLAGFFTKPGTQFK